ncbi:hypothetical protein BDDG_11659, partial [Blastomyces dermatitidis ATCC 18188]
PVIRDNQPCRVEGDSAHLSERRKSKHSGDTATRRQLEKSLSLEILNCRSSIYGSRERPIHAFLPGRFNVLDVGWVVGSPNSVIGKLWKRLEQANHNRTLYGSFSARENGRASVS